MNTIELSTIGATAYAGLGVIGAGIVIQALQGRTPATGDQPLDLVFPMNPGTYLVVNGGANERVNAHFLTLAPTTERQAAYRGQSYAVDLIKIDRLGLRASGWRPRGPAAYAIFGEPVYAPCAGTVIQMSDGQADMPVPKMDRSRLKGNHLLLRCGVAAVLLAHSRNASVRVALGDQVSLGQQLGEAGNSGQTGEPHLHIHAQRLPESGPLLSGEPLFLSFNGLFPVRNDRLAMGAEQSGQ